MNENKKKWDEKFKLALNELEGKIGEEDAKTSGRGRTRRTHREKYATKAEWKRAAFRQEVLLHIVMSAAFLLTTIALLQGIVRVLPESVTVSSSVNGRELPIYCVETDKKQIALSFDAAWGGGYLRKNVYCNYFKMFFQLGSDFMPFL